MQQASCLEGGPLLWIWPLHLHVNQKSDDDDDDDDECDSTTIRNILMVLLRITEQVNAKCCMQE